MNDLDWFKALVTPIFELWRDLSSHHPILAAQSARRFIEKMTGRLFFNGWEFQYQQHGTICPPNQGAQVHAALADAENELAIRLVRLVMDPRQTRLDLAIQACERFLREMDVDLPAKRSGPAKEDGIPTDDERRFMEIAIEEARKSVGEDGRAHPKVGAVIVKEGEVIATAFRGELGHGEHAEYTALEKKLPDETLAGATVYATLEPCTTRNHPKIPCAERLIDRKVKRVVIGMLDPNPLIRGKGERLLRDHGIEVERFPHELIMKLEEMNRTFVRAQVQSEFNHSQSPPQTVSELTGGLRDLHRRFVEAQDRFPREVSFALVMIPHDEWRAWMEAEEWFGGSIGEAQKYGSRCLQWVDGADTAQTSTILPSERTDGVNEPLLCPVEAWRCWLLRQSPTAERPFAALNKFLSLANDACRALDMRTCGQIIEGVQFEGRLGEFEHLLRWTIEQLPAEECKKLTWLDPPNQHVRTTLRPGHPPHRWMVEMPCVFAAVARALERHTCGQGKLWPATK